VPDRAADVPELAILVTPFALDGGERRLVLAQAGKLPAFSVRHVAQPAVEGVEIVRESKSLSAKKGVTVDVIGARIGGLQGCQEPRDQHRRLDGRGQQRGAGGIPFYGKVIFNPFVIEFARLGAKLRDCGRRNADDASNMRWRVSQGGGESHKVRCSCPAPVAPSPQYPGDLRALNPLIRVDLIEQHQAGRE